MQKKTILVILLMAIPIVCAFVQHKNSGEVSMNRDYVPDEKTAIKVAEAIWLPIYGESIYDKKPFTAKLINSKIWVVEGTLAPNSLGGVPYIELQKKDCKVLKVTHGK